MLRGWRVESVYEAIDTRHGDDYSHQSFEVSHAVEIWSVRGGKKRWSWEED